MPAMPDSAPHWITDYIDTAAGPVPRVNTQLQRADHWGTVMARVSAARMHYAVPPGLYAVGDPDADSPVFVTANYKMSFDALRRALAGRSGWILVVDTRGINVWCAAGKGTFSTDEVVARMQTTGLDRVAPRGVLVLPQLCATGVAAPEVRRQTGHRAVFGPVRAADLPAFLDAGMKATPEMRRVRFDLADRLTLVPIELVNLPWPFWAALVALFVLAGLSRGGWSPELMIERGPEAALLGLLGYLAGALLTPALLPWLPGRMFATKGAIMGLLMALINAALRYKESGVAAANLDTWSWLLMLPAMSAFLAMNFTGSSPYTSLSGVKHEIRVTLPLQIAGVVVGAILWLAARFV